MIFYFLFFNLILKAHFNGINFIFLIQFQNIFFYKIKDIFLWNFKILFLFNFQILIFNDIRIDYILLYFIVLFF